MAPQAVQGINYGIGQLPSAQINADLDYMRQYFDNIRITYPNFDSTSIPYWQDICERAKARGFNVMWGISCGYSTSNKFNEFINKFIELAPWANANGIIYGVNEEMFHNNDAVISDTSILTALHGAAATIKSSYPNLKLVIALAGSVELNTFMTTNGGGRGSFDYVGVNQYGTLAEHYSNIDKMLVKYGRDNICVTEFNTGRGFDPLYGDEQVWKDNVEARINYMKSKVMSYYAYTYAHNPELTTSGTNKWDFRMASNNSTHHSAFDLFK